jgi:hypothetical protein
MMKSEEVVEMRNFWVFYILMLIVSTTIAIFSTDSPALKEDKVLTDLGLYVLFFLVLLTTMVLILVGYSAESRGITKATAFLSMIVNTYPPFYMLITQTADPFIISFSFINLGITTWMLLDKFFVKRMW